MNIRSLLLISLFALSGCIWPFQGVKPALPVSEGEPSISVDVLQPELLGKGGKLAFIPFTAGVNAEAGPALDRLALLVVKGASDVLSASSLFQILNGAESGQADLILEGRIEEFTAFAGSFLGMGRKDGVIRIKAELRARRTGDVLAIVSSRDHFERNKNSDLIAYDIGRAIAQDLSKKESLR